MTLLDIGKIEKITVGHEAVGRGRGWLCDHIVLRQSDDHTETVFPCHRCGFVRNNRWLKLPDKIKSHIAVVKEVSFWDEERNEVNRVNQTEGSGA